MTIRLGLLCSHQIKGGEAGLATGEASLTLASLGIVPWEEGSGHDCLLPLSCLTSQAGQGLGLVRVGLVHSSLQPEIVNKLEV